MKRLLLFFLLAYSVVANAASANDSAIDKLVAKIPLLSEDVKVMNDLMEAIYPKLTKKQKSVLDNSQKEWLQQRISACHIQDHYELYSKEESEAEQCLIDLYGKRMYEILKFSWPDSIKNTTPKITLSTPYLRSYMIVTGELTLPEIDRLINLMHDYPFMKSFDCTTYSKDAAKNLVRARDIHRDGGFHAECGPLFVMKLWQEPRQHDLQGIHLNQFQYLSPSLLPVVAEYQMTMIDSYVKQGKTLFDLIQDKIVTVVSQSADEIRFSYDGAQGYYEEVARGNFDNSGQEEMLVKCGMHSIVGTLGDYGWAILMRSGKHQLLSVENQDEKNERLQINLDQHYIEIA